MCTFLYIVGNKNHFDNKRKTFSKNTIYDTDWGVNLFSIYLENKLVIQYLST